MSRINLETMDDTEAISLLEAIEGEYDRIGCYHPDWRKDLRDDGQVAVHLDGNFTREELLALVHFHPETKKEG
ncbi:hypothetical protein [Burkholderia phage FLC9]|nr:hypothetical protein [Burkholderia phage FLC9]